MCGDTGDRHGEALVRHLLGQTALFRGDLDAATVALESCRADGRALARADLEARVDLDLGEVDERRGNAEHARARYEAAAAGFRGIGDRRGEALALVRLGRLGLGHADGGRAHVWLAHGVALAEAAGDRRTLGIGLSVAARAALGAGRPRQAARLLGAAEGVHATLGAAVPTTLRAGEDALRAELRERLGETGLAAALADGRGLAVHRAVAEAQSTGAKLAVAATELGGAVRQMCRRTVSCLENPRFRKNRSPPSFSLNRAFMRDPRARRGRARRTGAGCRSPRSPSRRSVPSAWLTRTRVAPTRRARSSWVRRSSIRTPPPGAGVP